MIHHPPVLSEDQDPNLLSRPELGSGDLGPHPQGRSSRSGSTSGSRWGWLFLFVLIVVGFVIFRLWEEGTKAALRTTTGRLVEISNDPTAPGFQAYLEFTPTLLVAHTDDGDLVGVSVLTQSAPGIGGYVVLIGSDLLLEPELTSVDKPISVGDAFRDGGTEILRLLIAELFGFGFLEVIEVDTERLAAMMGRVDSIPINLRDDLGQQPYPGEFEVWIPNGHHLLDGATAASVYGFRNPGEPNIDRLNRQLGLWDSWLGRIRDSAESTDAVPEGAVGLPPYLRALGVGEVQLAVLPADPVATGDGYVLGEEHLAWIQESADIMVPVPIPVPGEQRPSVRLLDGVGDRGNLNKAMGQLFKLGMQVTMIGNTAEFGVDASSVTYHSSLDEAAARALAGDLGALLNFNENPEALSRFTVVVGVDWRVR